MFGVALIDSCCFSYPDHWRIGSPSGIRLTWPMMRANQGMAQYVVSLNWPSQSACRAVPPELPPNLPVTATAFPETGEKATWLNPSAC